MSVPTWGRGAHAQANTFSLAHNYAGASAMMILTINMDQCVGMQPCKYDEGCCAYEKNGQGVVMSFNRRDHWRFVGSGRGQSRRRD